MSLGAEVKSGELTGRERRVWSDMQAEAVVLWSRGLFLGDGRKASLSDGSSGCSEAPCILVIDLAQLVLTRGRLCSLQRK